MTVSGLPYGRARTPSTIGWWLTPRPSTNRPGNASSNVFWAAAAVIAARVWIEAMPVATTMRCVAPSRRAEWTIGSRPTASGSQMAP